MNRIAKRFAWLTLVLFIAGFAAALPAQEKEEMVKTFCCGGKEIKKADAKTFEYQGKVYYFCCDKCKEAFAKDPEKVLKESPACIGMCKDMACDPVCGMKMKKGDVKITAEYKGQTYSFCNEKCKEAFLKEPDKYLQTVYTCPMCAGVKADKPGKCPKCGMELKAQTMPKNCCPGAEGKHEMKKEAGKEAKSGCPMTKTSDCPTTCPGAKKGATEKK